MTGCTIGASSVVTKDIPDWSVAMGSPAKVVKKVAPVDDLPNGEANHAEPSEHSAGLPRKYSHADS